ncbi:MAG TPA: hypothetical protein VIU12_04670 [Chryseolinea sp.]
MKTRFRFATFVFTLLMLGFFSVVPWIGLVEMGMKRQGHQSSVTIGLSVVFLVILVAALVAIVWLTLRITIDPDRKTITFIYPFRHQSFTYDFNELIGFRYKYLNGKVNYKSLKFRTRSDLRTFSVSDFETVNLRALETFALQHFELRGGKEFRQLTAQEKKDQLRESQYFDQEQAKEIRFYLIVYLVLLALILVEVIRKLLVAEGTKVYVLCLSGFVIIITAYLTANRLAKLRKVIQSNKKENNTR